MAIEPENHRRSSRARHRIERALGGPRAGWSRAFVSSSCSSPRRSLARLRDRRQRPRQPAGAADRQRASASSTNRGLRRQPDADPVFGESDTYGRVFLVGLLNTLLVSVIGIFLRTILGFIVGLARLSPNWLLSRLAGGYVELIRNLPLLFQILFWYLAVLGAARSAAEHLACSTRSFSTTAACRSKADRRGRVRAVRRSLLVAIVGCDRLRVWARRRQARPAAGPIRSGPRWPGDRPAWSSP